MNIHPLPPTTTSHHPGHIQRFLELLHPGGETFEIRVIQHGGHCSSRFFSDPDTATEHIKHLDAKGIYTPLNPIASPPASGSTKAVDITRRHWVLIDFDPKRDKGTNATDDELLAAITTRELVDSSLKEAGFSEPLRVLSGNGAHLLYRVDLPAETDLVKRLVHGIAERYSTDRVDVDKNVHDAPRITKIAGTLTKKGEHTDERPQRVSVLENPGLQLHVTPEAVIRRYVESITPKTEPPPTPRSPRAAITLPQLQPIQTGCRFLQHCENSAATLSETDWFAMSSIVSLCEDGDEHMHRLSRPYPGYTEAETSQKIARAREHGKPHTCEQIASNGFAGCASCPHRGRITSPLQLGNDNTMPYQQTDLGNARLFADCFGDELRYVTEWKQWLVWDGRRWGKGEPHQANRRVVDLVQDRMPAVADTLDHALAEAYRDHARRSQSCGKMNAILDVASNLPPFTISATLLDTDPWVLNCLNGTLDLKTGELHHAKPDDLNTKLAPVEYEPGSECPTWLRFLGEIFAGPDGQPRQDLIRYVQKAAGYSATGATSEQCFFIAYGHGRNGKSTLLETLQKVLGLGQYALVAQQSVMMKRGSDKNSDDVADLAGVRLAVCSETTFGEAIDEAKVKQITGSSHLCAMRKYQNAFQFTATHTLWLDCNHKPYLTSSDTGMKRRVHLIPFDVEVPEDQVDHGLADKLAGEASGILNWLVEGVRLWQAEGLDKPDCVKQATEAYMSESDLLGMFIEDCIQDLGHPNSQYVLPSREIYEWYQDWAEVQGIRRLWKRCDLSRKLEDRGYEKDRNANVRGFRGIQLIDRYGQLSGRRTNPSDFESRFRPRAG